MKWAPIPISDEERPFLEAFGRELRGLRKATYLSQEDFAELVELSGSYVSLLENGKRRPRESTLARIAVKCAEFAPDLVSSDAILRRLLEAAGVAVAAESSFHNQEERRLRRLKRRQKEIEQMRQWLDRAEWRQAR